MAREHHLRGDGRLRVGLLLALMPLALMAGCIGGGRAQQQEPDDGPARVVGVGSTGPSLTTSPGNDETDEIIPSVQPLESDLTTTRPTEQPRPLTEAKRPGGEASPDAKSPSEAKKKTIAEFKPKPEPKYQKVAAKEGKFAPNDTDATVGQPDDVATTLTMTTTPVATTTTTTTTSAPEPEKSAEETTTTTTTTEPTPPPPPTATTTTTTTTTAATTPSSTDGTTPTIGEDEAPPTTTTATTMIDAWKIEGPEEKEEEEETTTTPPPPPPPAESNAQSRARALNVSAPELTNNLNPNVTDLSDVSMDEEDGEVEGGEYVALHNGSAANATPVNPLPTAGPVCVEGNNSYASGEKVKRGCEEECLCGPSGQIGDCLPVCQAPYVKSSDERSDPFCFTRALPDNPCCSILVCSDSAPEPEETCVFGNITVARGQKVEDGCSRMCICEAGGHLKCQPRCPPNDTVTSANQHDRCVALKDPNDSCCTITLCDVTLGDHEIKPENQGDLTVNLTDIKVLNSTAIKLKLSSKSLDEVTIEISENNHLWRQVKPTKDGTIGNLQPAHEYYVRVIDGSRAGPGISVSLPAEVSKTSVGEKSEKGSCSHRGKTYKIGAEWHDECIAICFCNSSAQTECATIECPTDFGLDVLDPHCLDWETVPPNHVPKAPNCCPQEVKCRSNGSCTYQGLTYENYSPIPTNVTGCENDCQCEFGEVKCHTRVCPEVAREPPSTLSCKAQEAVLTHLPGDECCLYWACSSSASNVPGFEHVIPSIGQYPGILGHGSTNVQSQQAYEISVEELKAISGNTVRLMFTVPSVLVGLHGRVEVRYTSDKSNVDPSTWKSQTFAPPGDLIDTEDLEFDLSGLKPSTLYKLMIVVKLRDLSNAHNSKIYQVRTLDKQEVSSVPTDITIDSELKVLQTNSTFAEFEWKKFTNYELQFIDGIYLMYKAEDDKTYSLTPLLHRSVNRYVLDHLKPLTSYEVHLSTKDIVGQTNVLIDSKTVNFTTTAETDPYSFDVKVEIKTIKSTDVEVSWSGVPQPQDKYVNIYRAVYQSDSGKEDTSTFKIAKKDSPSKTLIGDLKPGTRYRLWIEVYLTNGKVKKSNVQDFITKPGVLLPPGASQQQGKLASIPLHDGDYYGPLVIVAIVASLAILSTLILLMMLMKRRTSSKADISPRKTTSAYDNPSYKICEEAVANGRSKTSEHEMSTMNGSNGNAKETV